MKSTSNPNHSAHIAKLTNVRKHPKADRLMLADVLGCTLIVGLDSKEGDIGVYFQSGLQLSEEFAKGNDLIRRKDADGKPAGGMFEENRRVKAINLREMKSDGFFIGMNSLTLAGVSKSVVKELNLGDFFDVLDGIPICKKWVPKTKGKGTKSGTGAGGKQKEYPMFKKHFDTTQLRFKTNTYTMSDHIVVTEKLHGTSQRIGHVEVDIYAKLPWWKKMFFRLGFKKGLDTVTQWRDVVGTRNVILDKLGQRESGGFYSDAFRDKASQPFYGKLHKGETIYYEVVGFEANDKPIMGRCQNKPVGKDFEKLYGKETVFSYGCEDGTFGIYVYRITQTNKDGLAVDLNWDTVKFRCAELGVQHVPELFRGNIYEFIKYYTVTAELEGKTFEESIMIAADEAARGVSTLDGKHIKEGVCIRRDMDYTCNVDKHKSMEFKILEGIVKPETLMEGVEEES